MSAKKKIAILLHPKDRYPKSGGHFIWALRDLWRKWEIEFELLRGLDRHVHADLLIPHVDTTVLPDSYMEFFKKFPRVINRRVRDISKRAISRHLLRRGDAYDGPVIVKTDLNCGGATDLNFPSRKVIFAGHAQPRGWKAVFEKTKWSSDWKKINCISSNEYPIFESLRAVPDAVFDNPALVVERLLPEYETGFYHIRYYLFCGDGEYCWRMRSPNPVVRRSASVHWEEVSVPEALRAMRQELGLDYGKLDFVMRDGQPLLLDVNRTPGVLGSEADRERYAARVAPGIRGLF